MTKLKKKTVISPFFLSYQNKTMLIRFFAFLSTDDECVCVWSSLLMHGMCFTLLLHIHLHH